MSLVLGALLLLIGAAIAYHLIERMPQLMPAARRSHGRNDPKVAAAAMMYAVANEHGPLTAEQERHIERLLCAKMAIDPAAARACLADGRRLANGVYGDLNSRLHQLLGPVEHGCTRKEKQDVIDMLLSVAGPLATRLGPVREGIGRVTATLKQG